MVHGVGQKVRVALHHKAAAGGGADPRMSRSDTMSTTQETAKANFLAELEKLNKPTYSSNLGLPLLAALAYSLLVNALGLGGASCSAGTTGSEAVLNRRLVDGVVVARRRQGNHFILGRVHEVGVPNDAALSCQCAAPPRAKRAHGGKILMKAVGGKPDSAQPIE